MTTYVYGLDTCTGTDGSGISNRIPDVGFGAWENGIGCWALNASVQSNRYARTAAGSGGETLHNMLSGGSMPNDSAAGSQGLEYEVDLWRPDSALANQRAGFVIRNDGGQFFAVNQECIAVYWDRVSDALVDLKVRVVSNQVVNQQATVQTNVAWARNTALRLGCKIQGAVLTLYTEPQGGGTRTTYTPLTLSPVTLNDASHKIYGAWINLGIVSGFLADNFRLREQFLPSAPGSLLAVAV